MATILTGPDPAMEDSMQARHVVYGGHHMTTVEIMPVMTYDALTAAGLRML